MLDSLLANPRHPVMGYSSCTDGTLRSPATLPASSSTQTDVCFTKMSRSTNAPSLSRLPGRTGYA